MLQEREILALLLGSVVLVFVLRTLPAIRRVPSYRLLLLAFAFQYLSWAASIIEVFIWEDAINFVQHLCSGLAGLVLACWCWRYFVPRRETVADEP